MICQWKAERNKLDRPTVEELEALQVHCDRCPKPCEAQNDRTIITLSVDFKGEAL